MAQEQPVVGPKVGTRLTLMFQDGQVSGDSGCNRTDGPFTVEGHALTVRPLTTTRKACEDAILAQERELRSAFETATAWENVRGVLNVHRADGEWVLTANEMGE